MRGRGKLIGDILKVEPTGFSNWLSTNCCRKRGGKDALRFGVE